jgi:hypothetical protein
MDYSVAGLVGGAVALVAGLAAYIALIPSVQQRLISIAPRETAEQREDLEFKLGVMRRLILSVGFVAFGWSGYMLGKRLLGPMLGE